MTTLKFMTVDQHLVLQKQPTVASGDKNSVLIQIQLCSMWDGFDVKVAFYKDGNRDFVLDIPLENGACMVPPEMLDSPCVLNIGIWGKDARGRYKTSTMVKYRVAEGTPIEAGVTLIDVRDGTAEEDQVLAGATFYAGDTAKKTGSIPTYEDGDPAYTTPYTESDPTVPEWAKQPTKPKYTAEEVGARPNTWTPTESDPTVPAWAKKPNPPTPADIGAAPAGFGLGTRSAIITDWNAAMTNGWYMDNTLGTEEKHSPFIGCWAFGYSCTNGQGADTTQVAFSRLYLGSSRHQWFEKHRHYSTDAKAWSEWEWVNPPMQYGVEYPTTERFLGKPVYTMLIDMGETPVGTPEQKTDKDVILTVPGISRIVDYDIYLNIGNKDHPGLIYTFKLSDKTDEFNAWSYAWPDQNRLKIGLGSRTEEVFTAYAIVKYLK